MNKEPDIVVYEELHIKGEHVNKWNTWEEYYYYLEKYTQYIDWEFTGKIKYVTNINKQGIKKVEVYFELQDIKETKVSNPLYICKYYGTKIKTIPGYLKYWIYSEKFKFLPVEHKPSTTEVIYTCA